MRNECQRKWSILCLKESPSMFQVQVVIQLMVNWIGTKTLQIVVVQYNSFTLFTSTKLKNSSRVAIN